MATTSVPWARPSAFGLVAPPPLRVSRRPGAPVRAFRRSDLDGFARRVASSEALRDAWRSANNGIEQVVFEARRAAKRLDRRYDLFRRFDSAARAASNWARKIDQELGIGRRWRSFSVDFSRNWPRYRRELNDFLQTPLGRGLAGTCPACKRQFVGSRNQVIRCTGCKNIVWRPRDGFSRGSRNNSSSSKASEPDIIDIEIEEK
ncbi:ABC transporter transmembrane region [Musa troglodytarum]|uniref:ABC transporter transmembrane region n=1 Tax=Musa troglodytarum TaxID=320322 RepID=A0A9E7K2H2_9LILI|nr:ABC transporter transmembrane region [Musa troglodytarum]